MWRRSPMWWKWWRWVSAHCLAGFVNDHYINLQGDVSVFNLFLLPPVDKKRFGRFKYMHPSINLTAFPLKGRGSITVYPSCHWAREGTGRQSTTGLTTIAVTLDGERNFGWRKPMQTWENMQTPQRKAPSRPVDSCCEDHYTTCSLNLTITIIFLVRRLGWRIFFTVVGIIFLCIRPKYKYATHTLGHHELEPALDTYHYLEMK